MNDRAFEILHHLFLNTSLRSDAEDALKSPEKMARLGWDDDQCRVIIGADDKLNAMLQARHSPKTA